MTQLARTTHPRATTAPPTDQRAAQALTDAVHRAGLAPSLHDSRPWSIRPYPAGRPRQLHVRADRSQQIEDLDPTGRALVQSVGAALFDTRVALAAAGWATDVHRLPYPTDPDLLAVVELVAGPPDGGIAPLVDLLGLRDTRRPRFGPGVPDTADIALFRAAASAEDAQLVPLVHDEAAVVVLTTLRDDEAAWLRAGEALQRVLLEIARAEWVATPFSEAIEDLPNRAELRSTLAGDRWPQSILRIGPAPLGS